MQAALNDMLCAVLMQGPSMARSAAVLVTDVSRRVNTMPSAFPSQLLYLPDGTVKFSATRHASNRPPASIFTSSPRLQGRTAKSVPSLRVFLIKDVR